MDQVNLNVAVLGTPEHEGRMCGRAFEILALSPTYIDPARPEFPSTPKPNIVILSREWNAELRHAAIQARRAGIPVIYIMDGVIEWAFLWENWGYVKPEGTVLQPLIASHLCVIGRHPARILAALGLGNRIRVIGLPRLDGITRERVVNQDRRASIVITTANTLAHNTAHKVYVRAALRDLKGWFGTHPEIVPIWRVAEPIADEIGVTPSSQGSLIDTLRTANGVISFTSTVLLEAMLLGVATAQVDYRPVPQYVQTAWEIRSAEHIDSVIHELLYPPPEKMMFQEACLRDELELGDASARLAEVIRQAASRSVVEDEEPEVSERLTEGLLDYRQVHSHLSSFSVSPASRLQYELDSTYRLWDRDRERLAEIGDEIAKLRDGIGKLNEIPLVAALQRLSWLPGLRKTARLLKHLVSRSG